MSRRLPPELRDGQYRNWEVAMTTRYPLALSEMRWPSAPLDTFETEALARNFSTWSPTSRTPAPGPALCYTA